MMMHAQGHKNGYGAFSCTGPMMMRGTRSCGRFCGIMLILIGAFWLAAEMGWVVPELFWPASFLAGGTAILALPFARGRRAKDTEKKDKEA